MREPNLSSAIKIIEAARLKHKCKSNNLDFKKATNHIREFNYKAVVKENAKIQNCFDFTIPEGKAIMSNDILRSGLFGSQRKSIFVSNYEIPTPSNLKITFTGNLMNQRDYEIFELLIKSYKENGLEAVITQSELLTSLKRKHGGEQVAALKASLDKLARCSLSIETKNYKFIGHLLDEVAYDKNGDKSIYIKFGNRLIDIFANDNWTLIDSSKREKVSKSMLSTWIYNFYSTHANPFPYSVRMLKRLSNCDYTRLSDFRRDLIRCLEALKNDGWTYAIDSTDKLHIKRELNILQKKSLIKK